VGQHVHLPGQGPVLVRGVQPVAERDARVGAEQVDRPTHSALLPLVAPLVGQRSDPARRVTESVQVRRDGVYDLRHLRVEIEVPTRKDAYLKLP
jgi:hypothetical protein